jgi:hypothetical protein
LLGESDIEAALQRLDRLTQEEARMTGAQTLSVVYGLVGSMKAVIGAEWLPIICEYLLTIFSQDGKASMNSIRQDLGMCLT